MTTPGHSDAVIHTVELSSFKVLARHLLPRAGGGQHTVAEHDHVQCVPK